MVGPAVSAPSTTKYGAGEPRAVLGYDTNGDGHVDAFDTNGDGQLDTQASTDRLVASNVLGSVAQAQHQIPSDAGANTSLESLAELEALLEKQHEQLIAKGLLPPDTPRTDFRSEASESR